MDPTTHVTIGVLKAKHAGIFASSDSNASEGTLEGHLQGKSSSGYTVQSEDFTIPECYVHEDKARAKVKEFFLAHGFEIKNPEDTYACFDYHAVRGTTKIRVNVTPAPFMSFVTIIVESE